MLDNEANLQAEFYHQCKLIGLECALEVSTRAGRVDVVVLSSDRLRILAIIEVKKYAFSFLGGNSSQIIRYKRLGVPVYGLHPEKCPQRLAKTIQDKHSKDLGITLSEARGVKLFEPAVINRSKSLIKKINKWQASGLNVKAS